MSDGKISEKVVPIAEGTEHGYAGTVQDDKPNEAYTVTGVTRAADADAETEPPKAAKTSTSRGKVNP